MFEVISANPIVVWIDRWLSGEMEANELHPASESILREWPIDRRMNRADVGDDDPTLLEPIESGLLRLEGTA